MNLRALARRASLNAFFSIDFLERGRTWTLIDLVDAAAQQQTERCFGVSNKTNTAANDMVEERDENRAERERAAK
jgi:hypothetical protein